MQIMMGAARKSAFITEKDKLATAYHEGGHAVSTTRPLARASADASPSSARRFVHPWRLPSSVRLFAGSTLAAS